MIPLILVALVASCILTHVVRTYALKHDIMDTPNSRSSHVTPTPRGGGVSVVIVAFCIFFVFGLNDSAFLFLSLATLIVGGIGFLDDRSHIHPAIRLLAHFTTGGIVVFASGGLPPLVVLGFVVDLGIIGDLIAIVGVVWLLNLYNFMDGIDGIASVEALTGKLVISALMFASVGVVTEVIEVHLILAAAVLGFFVWNFPKAKIFMGDAGSGFLGAIVAGLMLVSAQVDQSYFWAWLIMLGVFVVDATITLIRRLLRGDKIFEAHRSHAYQWASRIHNSHVVVTTAVFVINILWLAPIAGLAVFGVIDGFLALVIAYIPLILLALRYKSGALEFT